MKIIIWKLKIINKNNKILNKIISLHLKFILFKKLKNVYE